MRIGTSPQLKNIRVFLLVNFEWTSFHHNHLAHIDLEDFALIDYASTSKIEAQAIVREALDLMIKEVG